MRLELLFVREMTYEEIQSFKICSKAESDHLIAASSDLHVPVNGVSALEICIQEICKKNIKIHCQRPRFTINIFLT